jgi:hypothetical protein
MPARSGLVRLLIAAMLALGGGLVLRTGLAHAETAGFVWNSSPTGSGTFTPSAAYSYDSAGGAITITHNSTGSYTVTFAGLGNGVNSNVEVTGYGSSPNFCQSDGWGSGNGTDVTATVLCFTPAGTLADNSFTLMYESRTSADHVPDETFVWANQPSTASYTPDPNYQFAFGGGPITVTRSSAGNYDVLIPGYTDKEPSLQVTAYGGTPAHCGVQTWTNVASGVDINVICTNVTAVPTDTYFELSYTRYLMPDYSPGATAGGAIFADNAKSTAPYVPPGKSSIQVDGEPMMVHETSAGAYDWYMDVEDEWTSTNVLAVAYGHPGAYCNVQGWGSSSLETDVYVDCFNFAGHPLPAKFLATFEIAGN